MNNVRQQDFHARLQRISAGGANTMTQVYAGPADTTPARRRSRKEERAEKAALKASKAQSKAKPKTDGAGFLVSIISGLLIGGGATVLARVARFHLTGGTLTGPDADLFMMADGIVAITLAIIVRSVFRFRSRMHGFGKLVGVCAMLMLMHNAVHIAPGAFERAFSVNWVRHVMATTERNTLLVAGMTYDQASIVKLSEVIPGIAPAK